MTGHPRVRTALLFVVYYLCIAALQWRSGAFQSEFSSDPDEPAHYVTGLMVRDYVVSGFPGNPLRYARDYYLHYPKVALGHWPPVFYIVQSAWTILFPPSRISVLLLMAALAAAVTSLTSAALRCEFSGFTSFCAGLTLLSLPAFQEYSHDVMAEMLMALLLLLAVLAYAAYLESGRWQSAAWFAGWCTTAILAKGSAIQLALLPPFAVLLTGRWQLVRRFSFWLPAFVVVAVAGPWYLWVPGAQHESVARFGAAMFSYPRFSQSLWIWASFLGVVPSAAAVAGIAVSFDRIRRGTAGGLWIAALAALLGAYVTRVFIGAFEARQLFANVPLLMLFAVAGSAWFIQHLRWPEQWTVVKTVLMVLGMAALIGFNAYNGPVKRYYGFAEVAQELLLAPQWKDSVFLVASDATGEGMLISEIAMHEARPGHIVLRASKMLASMDWMGGCYRSLFDDPDQQLKYLQSIPVGIIVIDGEGRATPHGRLLYEAIVSHPKEWKPVKPPVAGHGEQRPADQILIYRLIGHEGRPPGKIRIPMKSSLYGDFGN